MKNSLFDSIVVSGSDAFDFLQGQLSVDLAELPDGGQLRAAWCNPKGRVIAMLTVQGLADGYRLILPAEIAATVAARLTVFRFRSKVTFEIESAAEGHLGVKGAPEAWLHEQLLAGSVEIWAEQSEKFTPHMLNLDRIGAISLDKGCYTGQEVVARTHYRGASKRRLHLYRSAAPVRPGDKVADGERNIGEVVNAIGSDLLAVVPVAQAEASLHVDGVALQHRPLPYD